MGKHRRRPLGYQIIDKTVDDDGTALPFARFTCTGTGCTATIDIAIRRDTAQNPEWLAEQATRSGWRADARRATSTMCPTCLKRRRTAHNDINSELTKWQQQQKELAEMPKTDDPRLESNVVDEPIVRAIRQPTSEQRDRIGHLLDRHFDGHEGKYLDGYNDHRIAEEVNVPRVMVENIREPAYGPIRISAEQVALQAEIVEVRKAVDGVRDTATDLHRTVLDDLAKIASRLDAMEKQANAGLRNGG